MSAMGAFRTFSHIPFDLAPEPSIGRCRGVAGERPRRRPVSMTDGALVGESGTVPLHTRKATMSTKTTTAKPAITSKRISATAKRASQASRPPSRPAPAPQVSPANVNKREQFAAMLLRGGERHRCRGLVQVAPPGLQLRTAHSPQALDLLLQRIAHLGATAR